MLGEGSVFIAPDPGALTGYLEGLSGCESASSTLLCPGHGPPIWTPRERLDEYIEHRLDRERRLLEALAEGRRSTDELLDAAWSDVPAAAATLGGGQLGRASGQAGRRGAPAATVCAMSAPPSKPAQAGRQGAEAFSRGDANGFARRQDSPFPPIADYGFLSDCHTGALVASDGSIEWMCLPHFDSAVGVRRDARPGRRQLQGWPYGIYVPVGRRYLPGTNVIETTWMTPQGWLRVVDALTISDWHDEDRDTSHTRPPTDFDADHLLVRLVECIQGQVQVEMVCEPMLDYGATAAQWSHVEDDHGHGLDATDGVTAFRLFSDTRMGIEGNRAHSRHTMIEGEKRFCAISWTRELRGPRTAEQAEARIERTSHFWRTWLAEGNYPDHPWRAHLQRSALTLKGLTFMPTGALVAAPTTSLAGDPPGLAQLGLPLLLDARRLLHAVGVARARARLGGRRLHPVRRRHGAQRGRLACRSCTGSRAKRTCSESTLDHLKGYEGARPVRIGNGAYNQRQNDVYGAVLDSVYLHAKQRDHIPERLWPVLVDQVECAARVWKEPDQGIWEARGEPRHYVSSKLMCWVAMRPRRPARRTARRGGARRAHAGDAGRNQGRHPGAGRGRARRVPPALRHRRARRLQPADRADALPARPTTSACELP